MFSVTPENIFFLFVETPKLEYDNKFRDLIRLHVGTNLRIPVKVTGIPKPVPTWGKENKPMKSQGRCTLETLENVTTLLIKKVTREDDGMYTLKAVNDVGEDSATFDVEVIGKHIKLFLLSFCFQFHWSLILCHLCSAFSNHSSLLLLSPIMRYNVSYIVSFYDRNFWKNNSISIYLLK